MTNDEIPNDMGVSLFSRSQFGLGAHALSPPRVWLRHCRPAVTPLEDSECANLEVLSFVIPHCGPVHAIVHELLRLGL